MSKVEKDLANLDLRTQLRKVINRDKISKKDYFGDLRGHKNENTLRVEFENIHGITKTHRSHRSNRFFEHTLDNDIDIKCTAENNVNWTKLSRRNQLRDRAHRWWRSSKCVTAHNTTSPWSHKYQPGGTAILCTTQASYRSKDVGRDTTGLGRWCWVRLNGQQGTTTRVYSAYQPCPLTARSGTTTVASQHKHYFNSKNMDVNIRDQFVQDLQKELKSVLEAGEQIILGIDANDNVLNSKIQKALEEIGLHQPIVLRHGNKTPETYIHGRRTIDGIFCSANIVMSQGGYSEFCDGIGDHRSVWGDFTYESIFGTRYPEVISPNKRRLKLDDPRVVKRYLREYEKQILAHNGFRRAAHLEAHACYPLTPEEIAEYEALDKLHVQACLAAEKKCRKLKTGKYGWCPKYAKADAEVHLWELVCKRKVGHKIGRRTIDRYAKKADIKRPRLVSLSDAYQYWKRARKKLLLLQKDSNRRPSFLEELAKAREEHDGGKFESIKKQLITKERQKEQGRNIRPLSKKFNSILDHVEILLPDGSILYLSDKPGMEAAIIQQNSSEYQHCINTPPMVGQFFRDIGYLGLTHATELILRKLYPCPAELSPGAVKFIYKLAMPLSIAEEGPMSRDISMEAYEKRWSRAKEFTSSGISGLHFGHYKAGLQSPLIKHFEKALTNIPHKSGYSPSRWRKCVDVMLLKKDKLFLVHKLRTIVLLEPDFQDMTKHMGRTCMNNALKHDSMAPENFGSVHNRTGVEAGLVKLLFFDTSRQRRIPCSLCSNDAVACYNRISHAILSIAFQRLGVCPESIRSCLDTMQNMIHQVRTPYGDSQATHGHWFPEIPNSRPQQGAFQGIGNAPTGYAALSSPMNDTLRDEGYGIDITSSLTQAVLRLASICFVDDDDQAEHARFPTEPISDVQKRLQEAVHLWSECLNVTGGALSPAKSFWFLIDFIWSPKGIIQYADLSHLPQLVLTMPENGRQEQVERIDPNTSLNSDGEPTTTLGLRLMPTGKNTNEIKHLREVSNTWASKLRYTHLMQHDSWFALNQQLHPKLTWHSAATTLSLDDWNFVQSPGLNAGLKKSRICEKIKRLFVFAPHKFLGMGTHNAGVTSFISKFQMIYKHAGTTSPVNSALSITLEDYKIELGLSGSPFQYDPTVLKHCTVDSYFKCLHETAFGLGVRIKDPGPHLPLHRVHDQLLGDIFLAHYQHDPQKLGRLARCRLQVGCTALSEITSADGRHISTDAWNGNRSSQFDTPSTWPNMLITDSDMWAEWRISLRECFLHQSSHSLELRRPLGPWLHSSKLQWKWWYSPSTKQVYESNSANQGKHSLPLRTHHRFTNIHLSNELVDIPPDAYRATIRVTNSQLQASCRPNHTIFPDVHSTLEDTLKHFPDSQAWIVRSLATPSNINLLVNAIKDGTAIAVTDGSYKDSIGTASWIIQGPHNNSNISGNVVTPGTKHDAYRAELSGMLALIVIANAIATHHQIDGGKIEARCDNINTVRKAQTPHWNTSIRAGHFDLVRSIRLAVLHSPITWTFEHVYGHQDDKKNSTGLKTYGPLDRWASINVDMDLAAKAHLAAEAQRRLQNDYSHLSQTCGTDIWEIWIGDTNITTKPSDEIYDAIYGNQIINYQIENARLSQEGSNLVAWNILGKARSGQPLKRIIWYSKHSANECGVNKCLHRRNKIKNPSPLCPRCHTAEETSYHVLDCNSPKSTAAWLKTIRLLVDDLRKERTDPLIISAIVSGLRHYKHLPTMYPPTNTNLHIRQALVEQDTIGWRNFLFGLTTPSWATAQSCYFKTIGSRRSGQLWQQRMIRLVLEAHFSIWEHRNDFVHSNPEKEEELSAKTEADVRAVYACGHEDLNPSDLHLMHYSLDSILSKSRDQQNLWLENIKTARQCHKNSIKEQRATERKQKQERRARTKRKANAHNDPTLRKDGKPKAASTLRRERIQRENKACGDRLTTWLRNTSVNH